MPDNKTNLDHLRDEIDAIDDALHDLLMKRADVVGRISRLKPRLMPIRPDREAEILRRLVRRHQGVFPVMALVRVWREMISALTLAQGPLAVAVCVPADGRGYWDLARDHYGATTPMLATDTPMAALRALDEGSATVAVVPWPRESDTDPWWRSLMNQRAGTPRIVARLPFCITAVGRDELDAVVIANAAAGRTEDDRTVLAIEMRQEVSRGRVRELMAGIGLPAIRHLSFPGQDSHTSAHLIEVGDHVDGSDDRLIAIKRQLGSALGRLQPLGHYAAPLVVPSSIDPA